MSFIPIMQSSSALMFVLKSGPPVLCLLCISVPSRTPAINISVKLISHHTKSGGEYETCSGRPA